MRFLRNALFFLRVQWPLILGSILVVTGFWLAFQFVKPAPPNTLVMAVGPEYSGYDYFGKLYAEHLEKSGITLILKKTQGSLQNLQLVNNPDSGVDVALAQGGIGWMAGLYQYSPDEANVYSIAELYYEPLWLFTRSDETVRPLRDLLGKRLAVGIPGSGDEALSVDLLKWSGVTRDNSTFIELDPHASMEALRTGTVDAVFLVSGTGASSLRQWAADPVFKLQSLVEAEAISRRFGYLSRVNLPDSVLDLALGIPDQNIATVAPATVMVAQKDLHPALVLLLLEAAREIHSGHSILSNRGRFPSVDNLEFPLHPEAERYFHSGPPFLQRFLPYHIAVFIDRTKILLLPLLTLMIPFFRIAYPTYRWSVRRSIWKWYKSVSTIESEYLAGSTENGQLLKRLNSLQLKVAKIHVPFAYASELYTLRHHMILVRKLIEKDEGKQPED